MSYTRRDYENLSTALRNAYLATSPYNAHYQHVIDCEAVADVLASTNPRFDRDRFLRECGVS